jgi:hypothetical protein
MKTLTGLNDEAVLFDEVLIAQKVTPPTMKYLLGTLLNRVSPKDNTESAAIGQILLSMRSGNGELKIEDADYKMILEKLNENSIKMESQWHSQVLLWLKKFDKE